MFCSLEIFTFQIRVSREKVWSPEVGDLLLQICLILHFELGDGHPRVPGLQLSDCGEIETLQLGGYLDGGGGRQDNQHAHSLVSIGQFEDFKLSLGILVDSELVVDVHEGMVDLTSQGGVEELVETLLNVESFLPLS